MDIMALVLSVLSYAIMVLTIQLSPFRNDGITETLSLHEQSSVADAVTFARENAGFFAGAGTNAVVAFLYRVVGQN